MKRPSSWVKGLAALAAVVMAGSLAACSSDKPESASSATRPLQVWSRGGDPVAAATYKKIFAAFTAKTGIKVDYSLVAEFDTQLQARAAQKDLPDVLINDAGSMGNYVDQGFVLPIDRTELAGNTQISAASWKQVTGRDGKTYGIPWSRQANVLVIRKDWREALGLPQPKTWDDVTALAHAFATDDPDHDGKADTYGMVVPGTATNGYIARWGVPYIWQAGGELLRRDKNGDYTSAVDTPAVKTAMTYIRTQFCTPGNVVPGSINLSTADAAFFQQGTAGMYLTGPYNFNVFDQGVGRDNVEVVPMPSGPVSNTTLAEGENIYFGASSKERAEQKKLGEFLMTAKAQTIGMDSPAAGGSGPFSSVVRLPVNTTVDPAAVYKDPRWDTVAKAYTDSSRSFPADIDFLPFRQVLADGMNAIAADCSSDIDAQLTKIDQGFKAEIATQGIGK